MRQNLLQIWASDSGPPSQYETNRNFLGFQNDVSFRFTYCAELGFVVAIGSKSRFGEFGFFFYLFFIFFYLKFFVWLLRKFCSDFLKPKKVRFFVVVDVIFLLCEFDCDFDWSHYCVWVRFE